LLILIHSLVSRIYLPNELVYMIGERASEMFFVARGDLEELDTHGRSKCFHSDGAFFGDQLFQNGARRSSTVRCITHSELLILTRESLRKIMKVFPEFAMMVQKWSGQSMWKLLGGWEKIQYAVRTTRTMRMMGAKDVTFLGVMRHLNGVQPLTVEITNGDSDRKRKAEQDISYDQFRDQYALAFTKVHEEREKAKKKKERLKRLRIRKLKQKKHGGKMSVILGQDVVDKIKSDKSEAILLEPYAIEEENESDEENEVGSNQNGISESKMSDIQEGPEGTDADE